MFWFSGRSSRRCPMRMPHMRCRPHVFLHICQAFVLSLKTSGKRPPCRHATHRIDGRAASARLQNPPTKWQAVPSQQSHSLFLSLRFLPVPMHSPNTQNFRQTAIQPRSCMGSDMSNGFKQPLNVGNRWPNESPSGSSPRNNAAWQLRGLQPRKGAMFLTWKTSTFSTAPFRWKSRTTRTAPLHP